MFIELSEALACPDCGPPQGLVVVVARLDGRRVLDGFLGCPICEARFAIRDGVVRLGGGSDRKQPLPEGGAEPAAAEPEGQQGAVASGTEPEGLAELIAALFAIRDGRGYILVDEDLEPTAARIAQLSGGSEVIALTATAAGRLPASRTNRVAGAGPGLPVQTGALRALALGAPTEARLRDAVRALGPEGRLVVVRPTAPVRELLRKLPVETVADEPAAFLGLRARTV